MLSGWAAPDGCGMMLMRDSVTCWPLLATLTLDLSIKYVYTDTKVTGSWPNIQKRLLHIDLILTDVYSTGAGPGFPVGGVALTSVG